jgi:hypothetical protein
MSKKKIDAYWDQYRSPDECQQEEENEQHN